MFKNLRIRIDGILLTLPVCYLISGQSGGFNYIDNGFGINLPNQPDTLVFTFIASLQKNR